MISVLMVDRFDINRLGFRAVLERNGISMTIDEVSTVPDLLTNLSSYDYNLVVIEPSIADGEGETLLRRIKELSPKANILVLTAISETTFGVKALQSGATGYLMKTCSAEELIAAVARVGVGKIYITHTLAESMARAHWNNSTKPLYEFLSEREFQIFAMLVCGKTVTNIARELGLSTKTISTHKCRILTKLNVSSISDVVKYAISQNLIEDCRVRSVLTPPGQGHQPEAC